MEQEPDELLIKIKEKITKDFKKDLEVILKFDLEFYEEMDHRLKALHLIELCILLIILYKPESEYLNYFLKIDSVNEVCDTEDLKNFLSNIVKKVNDNFNEYSPQTDVNMIIVNFEEKIKQYEILIEKNQIKQKNFDKLKIELNSYIEKNILLTQNVKSLEKEIANQKEEQKSKFNQELEKQKKNFQNTENFYINKIEKLKQTIAINLKKLEELSDKNEYLLYEKDHLINKIASIKEKYIKSDKYHNLHEKFCNLKDKLFKLENSLLIENSEKSSLKYKINQLKNEHGEKLELQRESYICQIHELERKFSTIPKSFNSLNLKKSSYINKCEQNENAIDFKIQNKIKKNNENLTALNLSEQIFEMNVNDLTETIFFNKKSFIGIDEMIHNIDYIENVQLSEDIDNDSEEFEENMNNQNIDNTDTLKMIKNINNQNKMKLKENNLKLRQDNSVFIKGFEKIKKILNIRNKKFSFAIIIKELQILIEKVKTVKRKNLLYQKSKMEIIQDKNNQISLLYSLLIKG